MRILSPSSFSLISNPATGLDSKIQIRSNVRDSIKGCIRRSQKGNHCRPSMLRWRNVVRRNTGSGNDQEARSWYGEGLGGVRSAFRGCFVPQQRHSSQEVAHRFGSSIKLTRHRYKASTNNRTSNKRLIITLMKNSCPNSCIYIKNVVFFLQKLYYCAIIASILSEKQLLHVEIDHWYWIDDLIMMTSDRKIVAWRCSPV